MRRLLLLVVVVFAFLVTPASAAITGGSINIYVGSPIIPSLNNPATAALWIDTNGGNCTRQPGGGAYSDAGACSSIQTALAACTTGDQIRMKGSATPYGSQSISATTACTVTGETTPNTVTIPSLSTGGSSYTVENLVVDTGSTHAPGGWGAGGTNVTGRNIKLHGLYVSFTGQGGSGVTWDGGELGQADVPGGLRNCGLGDNEPVSLAEFTNLKINNVTFYQQNPDTTPCAGSSNGFHLEMIRLDHGSDGFTLTNSFFVDGLNDNSNTIFITEAPDNTAGGEPRNLVFANNYFGSDNGATFGVNIQVQTCLNWTIAYNTFVNRFGAIGDTANTDGCVTDTNVVTVGNLGSINGVSPCVGTHLKNRWQNSATYTCGTDSTSVGTAFAVDQLGITSGTGRLTGTSVARNGGETTYCASVLNNLDFEGGTRPQGSANCDNGFDEVG